MAMGPYVTIEEQLDSVCFCPLCNATFRFREAVVDTMEGSWLDTLACPHCGAERVAVVPRGREQMYEGAFKGEGCYVTAYASGATGELAVTRHTVGIDGSETEARTWRMGREEAEWLREQLDRYLDGEGITVIDGCGRVAKEVC